MKLDPHALWYAWDGWNPRLFLAINHAGDNPVWNNANALSGSCAQDAERGLSDQGRDFLRRMEEYSAPDQPPAPKSPSGGKDGKQSDTPESPVAAPSAAEPDSTAKAIHMGYLAPTLARDLTRPH